MAKKKLTVWNRVGYGVAGLAALAFCTFGFYMWFFTDAGDTFRDLPVTVADVQPELTGNYAVDKEIVRSAGEWNFTILLMFAVATAGWLLLAWNGIKMLLVASIGNKGKH